MQRLYECLLNSYNSYDFISEELVSCDCGSHIFYYKSFLFNISQYLYDGSRSRTGATLAANTVFTDICMLHHARI